jgi:hypothetical protein
MKKPLLALLIASSAAALPGCQYVAEERVIKVNAEPLSAKQSIAILSFMSRVMSPEERLAFMRTHNALLHDKSYLRSSHSEAEIAAGLSVQDEDVIESDAIQGDVRSLSKEIGKVDLKEYLIGMPMQESYSAFYADNSAKTAEQFLMQMHQELSIRASQLAELGRFRLSKTEHGFVLTQDGNSTGYVGLHGVTDIHIHYNILDVGAYPAEWGGSAAILGFTPVWRATMKLEVSAMLNGEKVLLTELPEGRRILGKSFFASSNLLTVFKVDGAPYLMHAGKTYSFNSGNLVTREVQG